MLTIDEKDLAGMLGTLMVITGNRLKKMGEKQKEILVKRYGVGFFAFIRQMKDFSALVDRVDDEAKT